ncbi:MAG: ABC transporter permease [Gemmatimonadota bacterium]|nr:MAG: ABC transporter permease [Gemmatimonadota bacterium]
MFQNYLKVAIRNIVRQKGYSFINIFGLAVGIACCILIMVWVHNEVSYDGFHQKADRIYRLYGDLTLGGNLRSQPIVGAPVAPALQQAFPEIENTVRMSPFDAITAKYGDIEFRENNIYYADNSFFEVFTLPLIIGDPATALTTRYSIVLTEKIAHKYFGEEDPLGKSLRFSDGRVYTVTGVMKDIPPNSHFTFDILCSYETWIIWNEQEASSWGWMEQTTYILTAPGVDFKTLEKKFEPVVYENLGSRIEKVGATFRIGLQPLSKIHLYSNFEDDPAKIGNIMYVYIFSGVALFMLLIGCINFVNLSTARYSSRALEVGLRKTLGASRNSLVQQFLGETILVTFFAVILGYLFVLMLLPALKSMTGQELSYWLFLQPQFLFVLMFSVLGIGVFAGAYPAIFLSSFQPVKTLKGHLKMGAASSVFRRILVVGQFSISIALIVGTLIIYDQLQFVRNKHLGFNKDQVLTLPYPNDSQNWSVHSLRHELSSIPGVMNVGFSSNVPGTGFDMRNFRPEGRTDDESILMQHFSIEPNLLPTLGIEIMKGRNFSTTIPTDHVEAVLINETTAKQLGWNDPIGKSIFIRGRGSDGQPTEFQKRIVGVVKDFHSLSLRKKITPLVIFNNQSGFSVIAVKLSGSAISETVSRLREKWESLFPDQPYNYAFLDESFDNLYKSEEQMNTIFTSFSFIAIIISCLGLFGLAAYMTEKRRKEVGIRKVMGASVSGILFSLSKEFTRWVLIANIIAWPVAYYFMDKWLQLFAYHVDINVGIFVLSGLIALFIAWITVSYQSLKIARTNPVDDLRYE